MTSKALHDPVRRAAAWRPDCPAVVCDGRPIDYAGLDRWVDRLASALVERGLGPGERLAVLLPNGPLYVALIHAVGRVGAVVVPLNTRLTSGELGKQVESADPAVMVAETADHGSDVLDGARRLLSPGDLGDEPDGDSPEVETRPTALTSSAADSGRSRAFAAAAPLAIVYTSGTTGRPKGAVLTHGSFRWSAAASALRLGHLPGDRWLVPLPLCHVGGLATVMKCALYGTTLEVHRRFDAAVVTESLKLGHVTQVSLVPTMLARVLDVWGDGQVPSALRVVLLGGGPIQPHLAERALALGLPLYATYGLTEACSQVATGAVIGAAATPASAGAPAYSGAPVIRDAPVAVGLPLAATHVKVVQADGHPSELGETGEVLVRGPTVMAGYWRDPAGTERSFDGGWLRTGDHGRMCESGVLHVDGRRVDLIVTGGENVYPAEVEGVLDSHPEVAASCVVGVEDDEWGEVVVALIEPAPGQGIDRAAIERHCRKRLAGYKIPRRLHMAQAIPRTGSGKIDRSAARSEIESREGRGSGRP